MKFDVRKHMLVPEHILLSAKEAKKVLKEFNAEPHQFPKILVSDPCAKMLGAKVGDLIKIIRKSTTAGRAVAYRVVVEE